jgi:predicted MPP superfamily phosphohydrolase
VTVKVKTATASVLAAVIGGAAAFAWGSLVERNLFTIRRATVPILPPGSRPIKVLHLSDVHMAPWQTRKQKWISQLAALEPDLIVNTGDNLGHSRGLEGVKRAYAAFEGIPGVYVWGSNDYFGPQLKNPLAYFGGPSNAPKAPELLDIGALNDYLEGIGWTNLNNSAAALQVNGTRLEFFGVDDPHRHFDRLDKLPGAIESLREDDSESDSSQEASVTIGVAHAPYRRVLDPFVNEGAAMIFAGHTHGGQVCVPIYGALVTNCDIPRKQVKGLSLWTHGNNNSWLNVSAGVGTSITAPLRFACRPEVSLITLVAAG